MNQSVGQGESREREEEEEEEEERERWRGEKRGIEIQRIKSFFSLLKALKHLDYSQQQRARLTQACYKICSGNITDHFK